jgi:hypothetical protein
MEKITINIRRGDQQINVGATFKLRQPFHRMGGYYRVRESFFGKVFDNLDKCDKIGEFKTSWS